MRLMLCSVIAAVLGVMSLDVFAAEPPITVALTTTQPSDAALVQSLGTFDGTHPDRPMVYYAAYDTEMLLPTRKLVFNAPQASQTLSIRGQTITLQREGESLTATVAGQKMILKPSGLGLESLSVPLGAQGSYVVAFPRAYTYEGALTVFCRSGCAQTGTLDGQPLTLYDDNLDGQYSLAPAAGPAPDGLCLGPARKASVFAPLGSLIPTMQAVYKIDQLAADGSAITLSRFIGPTGKLRIQLAAKDLEGRVALAGEDGQCSAVILAGQTPLVLPAGSYRLLYGLLYRPTIKRVAAVLTPGKLNFTIISGQELTVTLGDTAQRDLAAADQALYRGFDAMLEVDLSPVEAAADAGDFDKAPKLLGDLAARYKDTPNYLATKAWFESLARRLEFEATPQASALRAAQSSLMAAIKRNDYAAAKAALPDVQKAFQAIADKFAANPAYVVQKARVQAMARYTVDRQLGLKVAYYGHNFSQKTGTDVVDKVFWEVNPRGGDRQQFLSARYEGYLVAPADGQYELFLESENGARLWLDEKQVIDHWKGHNLAEKSVKLDLKAGAHPLKIEYYLALGGAALHFRWTPPAGRKVMVPAWALESLRDLPLPLRPPPPDQARAPVGNEP